MTVELARQAAVGLAEQLAYDLTTGTLGTGLQVADYGIEGSCSLVSAVSADCRLFYVAAHVLGGGVDCVHDIRFTIHPDGSISAEELREADCQVV
jgi:hypothetical protein